MIIKNGATISPPDRHQYHATLCIVMPEPVQDPLGMVIGYGQVHRSGATGEVWGRLFRDLSEFRSFAQNSGLHLEDDFVAYATLDALVDIACQYSCQPQSGKLPLEPAPKLFIASVSSVNEPLKDSVQGATVTLLGRLYR